MKPSHIFVSVILVQVSFYNLFNQKLLIWSMYCKFTIVFNVKLIVRYKMSFNIHSPMNILFQIYLYYLHNYIKCLSRHTVQD